MGKTPILNQEVLISNIIKQQIKGGEVTDYRNHFSRHLEADICGIKYKITVNSTVADLSIVCLSEEDTKKREMYLKTHYGKMFLKKRFAKWFSQGE